MNKFNLQQALQGVPVCTRDGRKVEILKTDMKNERPILAVVTSKDGKREYSLSYFTDGRLVKRWIPNPDATAGGRKLLVEDNIYDLMLDVEAPADEDKQEDA